MHLHRVTIAFGGLLNVSRTPVSGPNKSQTTPWIIYEPFPCSKVLTASILQSFTLKFENGENHDFWHFVQIWVFCKLRGVCLNGINEFWSRLRAQINSPNYGQHSCKVWSKKKISIPLYGPHQNARLVKMCHFGDIFTNASHFMHLQSKKHAPGSAIESRYPRQLPVQFLRHYDHALWL